MWRRLNRKAVCTSVYSPMPSGPIRDVTKARYEMPAVRIRKETAVSKTAFGSSDLRSLFSLKSDLPLMESPYYILLTL